MKHHVGTNLIALAGMILFFFPIARADFQVGSQGIFLSDPGIVYAPNGKYSLKMQVAAPVNGAMRTQLTVFRGETRLLNMDSVPGNAFLVSNDGVIIAVDRPETNHIPAHIRFYDRGGTMYFQRPVFELASLKQTPDGNYLTWQCRQGTVVLNMNTLREQIYDRYYLTAVGSDGLFFGCSFTNSIQLEVFQHGVQTGTIPLDFIPVKMLFSRADAALYLISTSRLIRLDSRDFIFREVFSAGMNEDIRDMRIRNDMLVLGLRTHHGDSVTGKMLILNFSGEIIQQRNGPRSLVPHVPLSFGTRDEIPWPLHPDSQHIVGNTYGSFQSFGYPPYLHPGIDILGSPGQAVYAVRGGVVKAILTISGDLHWRVAVGDEDTPAETPGYLYAHLEHSSIAVNVGDTVAPGQFIGNLVEFPYGFTHIHFARISESGATWSGEWTNPCNPQLDISNQTELTPPVFLPARGSDMFAFCENETSHYLSADHLHGQVDIIAHIYDLVASDWRTCVQEIRYSIYPEGHPESPVVDDLQSVYFNMELDTYLSGSQCARMIPIFFKQDGTCPTVFDWDARELYHIVTNTTGDQIYDDNDKAATWDTTLISDGDYVVSVTARDVAGNETTSTMVVTTENGNTSTPTPRPTNTPPMTCTPFPTFTPPAPTATAGPSETATPAPEPSQTPTSAERLGVRIEMPEYVHPGDAFFVRGFLDNPGPTRFSVPVFFVMDIHGEFWFWPSWAHYHPPENPDIDYKLLDIPEGTAAIDVISEMTWPDTGSMRDSGLYFYGALLNEYLTEIIGDMAVREWGFGPRE